MNNKKGFAILETIIVVVMMTTSLLMIYSTYNTSIQNEKKRIYYDDVVDIYKIDNLKNYILEYSNYELLIDAYFDGSILAIGIGTESGDLFSDINYAGNVVDFYDVDRLLIIQTDFNIISKCTNSVIKSTTLADEGTDERICQDSFAVFDYDLIYYIRSLGSNIDLSEEDYILVGSFNMDNSEKKTYAYTILGGSYE